MKNVEVDEAVISFASDLFSQEKIDIKLLMKHLDQRGIEKSHIIFSDIITNDEKINILQEIES